MKNQCLLVAAAAALVLCLASSAQAGCVIAPDGKSIKVVADNPSREEKNCAVKCQVDTKVGVVQLSCGGNTPPLAKDHALSDFDKPARWYNKVVSAQESCQPIPGRAPAAAAPAGAPLFFCEVSIDGKSLSAKIVNPYKRDASCTVNCEVSTTRGGTTFQTSCTKEVPPGEAVVCAKTFERGRLVKQVDGSGSCLNPEPPAKDADKEDKDDADLQKTIEDPTKLREEIRKNLPPEAQRMLDQMNKP